MSMNCFFKSFDSAQIEALSNNHKLIDQWILDNPQFIAAQDVQCSWDVLRTVLDGDGFDGETTVYDALFNGCTIASPRSVHWQAQALNTRSDEEFWQAVENLSPDADLYHQISWTSKESKLDLYNEFIELKTFFDVAAQNNHGIVIYIA